MLLTICDGNKSGGEAEEAGVDVWVDGIGRVIVGHCHKEGCGGVEAAEEPILVGLGERKRTG